MTSSKHMTSLKCMTYISDRNQMSNLNVGKLSLAFRLDAV